MANVEKLFQNLCKNSRGGEREGGGGGGGGGAAAGDAVLDVASRRMSVDPHGRGHLGQGFRLRHAEAAEREAEASAASKQFPGELGRRFPIQRLTDSHSLSLPSIIF